LRKKKKKKAHSVKKNFERRERKDPVSDEKGGHGNMPAENKSPKTGLLKHIELVGRIGRGRGLNMDNNRQSG